MRGEQGKPVLCEAHGHKYITARCAGLLLYAGMLRMDGLTRICDGVDNFALAFGITCFRSTSIDTGASGSATATFAAPGPLAKRASCDATPQ